MKAALNTDELTVKQQSIEVALDTDQGHKTMKKLMICMIAVIATLAMNASGIQGSKPGDSNSGDIHSRIDVVKPKTTDVYKVYFSSSQEAEVLVIGDGDTDLDLYVYDENDNLIESDTDNTDNCYVSWTPKWSGYFKIKIKNYGNQSNRYLMLTN